MTSTFQARTLEVPGGSMYYEVQAAGPNSASWLVGGEGPNSATVTKAARLLVSPPVGRPLR